MKYGAEILAWATKIFGPVAGNRHERACRLLEEAIELAQVERVNIETVAAIAARVYSRPPGHLDREIGQVQMTLACLAANLHTDADALGEKEFERVKSIPQDEWQRRHEAKIALGIANG